MGSLYILRRFQQIKAKVTKIDNKKYCIIKPAGENVQIEGA